MEEENEDGSAAGGAGRCGCSESGRRKRPAAWPEDDNGSNGDSCPGEVDWATRAALKREMTGKVEEAVASERYRELKDADDADADGGRRRPESDDDERGAGSCADADGADNSRDRVAAGA